MSTARKPAAKAPAKKAARPTVKPAAKPAAKLPAAAKKTATKVSPRAVGKPTAKPVLKPVALSSAAGKPPAEAAAKPVKTKLKLVRDSFTMPEADFNLIHVLKERALNFKRPAKKSELLRAGLHALSALDDVQLRARLDALVALKPGRPKTHD